MTEHQRASQRIHPSASPEEAGAIVAAMERFRRVTAAVAPAAAAAPDEWALTAILEGVSRQAREGARDPWINT
jgi:hypothetical protein